MSLSTMPPELEHLAELGARSLFGKPLAALKYDFQRIGIPLPLRLFEALVTCGMRLVGPGDSLSRRSNRPEPHPIRILLEMAVGTGSDAAVLGKTRAKRKTKPAQGV